MYVRDSGESKKTNVMNFAGTFYFNYSVRASNRDLHMACISWKPSGFYNVAMKIVCLLCEFFFLCASRANVIQDQITIFFNIFFWIFFFGTNDAREIKI